MALRIRIEEMVGAGIILVHTFFHQAQAKNPRIKIDVLLSRRRVRWLREDEDLALYPSLQLLEALVDRVLVPQNLDVLERISVLLPGLIGGSQFLDHRSCRTLHLGEALTMVVEQPFERDVGRCGGVLHHATGPGDGEALADEARQHVVDALPGHTRQAGDL